VTSGATSALALLTRWFMSRLDRPGVLSRARRFTIGTTIVVSTLGVADVSAQPRQEQAFSGFYMGVEGGTVNVIAGALVGGVDTLAQDTRGAVALIIGGRYQFASRLVLGVEFGVAREDGDLVLDDPLSGARVEYRNNSHTRIGGTAGVVLGSRRFTHVFGYLSELSRSFDVTIIEVNGTNEQQDDQGLLRFGGGIEQRVASRLSVRATLGSSRADFGGRPTNIVPPRPLEMSAGLLFRF
jgi:hypothetical protein